ncbi:MAG: hypothetical protein JO208_16150 [Alphaproteobacteria bacterium]|nr:hypothetical protein [Alphaproteobacteria bacterium]
MRKLKAAILSAAILAASVPAAHATLQISDKSTKNMSCSAGECSAIDADAVMNVNDLVALLNQFDVHVVADPASSQDIVVVSPLAWAAPHALALESDDVIYLRNTITVQGQGGLDFRVAGGPIFQKKGAVHFWDTASHLTIDGQDFRLVNSVAGLAAAVAAHPGASLALANDYDAKADGQYKSVPVSTPFAGTFEGLGNTISNFSIWDTAENNIALFASIKGKAVIRNLGMAKVNVLAENTFNNAAGGLVAYNAGTILNCRVDGGTVRTDFAGTLGGLVGITYGHIYRSWANVSVEGAQSAEVGGLVGNAHGQVQNVYALGRVIAGDQSDVGGLIGYNFAHVRDGYSTGQVSGGQNARVGGSLGTTQLPVHDLYWDTETSGTTFGVAGTNIDGVTGMTTAELQAGLPPGFLNGSWSQSAKVNQGFPYLAANPPR